MTPSVEATTQEQVPILRFDEVVREHSSASATVRALGPVSFDVHQGEFVAIMGPSGSGKTTMLALAGALDRPTTGRVLLAGHDLNGMSVSELSALRRRTLGYVFQDLNLLPGLTALENIALPLELDGSPARVARREACTALEGVGLSELGERFPDDLSGGERQRVAVARSFVGPRSILLADEPTGALDSVTGERVMRLLRSRCEEGCTVVLVTHDNSHAGWADRVLFLRDGLIDDEAQAKAPRRVTRPVLVSPNDDPGGPTGIVP